MAAFTYNLTYAGVPFVGDKGIAFRHPAPYTPRGMPEEATAALKQQPLPDLLDDINRLLPQQYLADFTEPHWYRSKRLDALAYPWAGSPLTPANLRIGDWYYPVGASRFSVFRGLATSSMVKQILNDTDANTPNDFVISAIPQGAFTDGSYSISTQMYLLPPRPLAEHGGSFDGLFLLTLVDERYSKFQYAPVSLQVTNSSTWQSLIQQCATALGITVTIPTIPTAYGTRPAEDSQLWVDEENAAFLLDVLAASIGMRVVRNFDGSYVLQTAGMAQAQVTNNRGNAATVVRVAGGDIFNTTPANLKSGSLAASKNAVVPAQVEVTFAKYVTGNDPVPHYINTRYSATRPTAWYEDSHGDAYNVTVPIAQGGSAVAGVKGISGATHVIHSTAKALYASESDATGSTPTNASDLNALAVQVAQDYYAWQVGAALDEVYPGILNWTPEGFHDLIYTYSDRARGAFTRVLVTQWNNFVRDMQHATSAGGTVTTAAGVGGHSVAQTWIDQSGTVVPGVNLVSVLGGTVSGQLYSGGVQEVYLNFATGVENVGLRSGYDTTDPVIVSGQWVSGVHNVRFDQNAFNVSGWAQSGDVDVFTNLKVSLATGGAPQTPIVSGVYNLMFDQGSFTVSGYQQSGTAIVFGTQTSTSIPRLGNSVGLSLDYNILSGAHFGPTSTTNNMQDTGLSITLGAASGLWQLTCDTAISLVAGGGTPVRIDSALWDDTKSGVITNSQRVAFFEPSLGVLGAISGAKYTQPCTTTLVYNPSDGGSGHVIRLLVGNNFTGHGLTPNPSSCLLIGSGLGITWPANAGTATAITVLSYELI